MQPRIMLATLCLNEMEWLPELYAQHKDWPGLVGWAFVESADRVYAEVNPELVTNAGLSTDGTTSYLRDLREIDSRVHYIPLGLSQHKDRAQGKCESRNWYLNVAEGLRPEFLIVLDADEFYAMDDQDRVVAAMRKLRKHTAFVFRHRDIWHPPYMQGLDSYPLMQYEVRGGFWDIPYCRCWRWQPGLRYVNNHNTPEVNGVGLDRHMARLDQVPDYPEFVHMAFASNVANRRAKHRYYAERGEARDPKRSWYVESRAAYETWKPGDKLPRDAKVCFYDGVIPECFQ